MHIVKTIPKIKQNITPEMAVQVLAANGLRVNKKEATAVVKFLYTLAAIQTTSL